MDNHNIEEMLSALENKGLISNRSKARKVLLDYWKDRIAVIWCTDDVLGRAQERGKKISKKKARDILSNMLRRHDTDLGISWTTIDCWLDN